MNLSLGNVVVVFYIEQMDRLLLQNLEDAEIICEDMYFVAVKIEKAQDIKKISKVFFEGNFRFTGFLMINNKEKLKEICLKCMDIRRLDFYKDKDDLLRKKY